MENPLVSVIVPVYNGERYLRETLESILQQDYRPLEPIVVDDGSTDDTAAIIRSFPRVRYLYQANQGHGKAKNTGVEASRGELLSFLDADDIWVPNKLSLQVDYVMKHPEIGYVISMIKNFLEKGTERPGWIEPELLENEVEGYTPCALLVRRPIFETVGNFDPSFRHANDLDWFFRAKDAGVPYAIVPQVLMFRRIHASNMSYRRQLEGATEILRVVKSSIDRMRHRDSGTIPDDE